MMIIRKKIVFALSMLLIIGSAVFVQSAVALWDDDQNILTQVIYKDGTDNEIGLDLDLDLTTVDLEAVGNQELYRADYGLASFATGTTWADLQLAFVGRGPAETIYFSTTKETAPEIGTTSFTACSGALTGAVQGGYSIAGTNPAVIAAASATGSSYYSGQNSNGNVPGFFAGLNAGYIDGQYGEASLAPLDTDGGYVDMYLYRVSKSGRSAALDEGTATPYVAIVRLAREGDEIVTIMNPGETPVDTDGDGVVDDDDQCPDTPAGTTVDETGCPADTDGDGVPDDDDQCPDTPAGTDVDEDGCTVVVVVDSDGDGVADDDDLCADTPSGTTVDATGCPLDTDGDGVADDDDLCADTPSGTTVDATGCALDTDGDGVADDDDLCADTPSGTTVDATGCALDTDGDGVPDDEDQCENTASGAVVDEDGCSTADADGDGVTDDKDECADTASGTEVDDVGCAVSSDDDDDDDDDSDLCFISSMFD